MAINKKSTFSFEIFSFGAGFNFRCLAWYFASNDSISATDTQSCGFVGSLRNESAASATLL